MKTKRKYKKLLKEDEKLNLFDIDNFKQFSDILNCTPFIEININGKRIWDDGMWRGSLAIVPYEVSENFERIFNKTLNKFSVVDIQISFTQFHHTIYNIRVVENEE